MKKIINYFVMTVLVSMSTAVFTRYAEAQTNCSTQEMQIYQSYVQLVTQAANNMRFEYINPLTQEFLNKISPGCFNYLVQLNTKQPHYGGSAGGYSAPPSSITNHGGGTYNYGGVTCGSSGCY